MNVEALSEKTRCFGDNKRTHKGPNGGTSMCRFWGMILIGWCLLYGLKVDVHWAGLSNLRFRSYMSCLAWQINKTRSAKELSAVASNPIQIPNDLPHPRRWRGPKCHPCHFCPQHRSTFFPIPAVLEPFRWKTNTSWMKKAQRPYQQKW